VILCVEASPQYDSRSLRDFIYESNKGRRIVFGSTVDEVIKLLG